MDGGASANNFLMQTQANITNIPVQRPICVETTAMGAAYLAGLAVGYWSGKDELLANRRLESRFVPDIDEAKREKMIAGWRKAVRCSYGWAKDI